MGASESAMKVSLISHQSNTRYIMTDTTRRGFLCLTIREILDDSSTMNKGLITAVEYSFGHECVDKIANDMQLEGEQGRELDRILLKCGTDWDAAVAVSGVRKRRYDSEAA